MTGASASTLGLGRAEVAKERSAKGSALPEMKPDLEFSWARLQNGCPARQTPLLQAAHILR